MHLHGPKRHGASGVALQTSFKHSAASVPLSTYSPARPTDESDMRYHIPAELLYNGITHDLCILDLYQSFCRHKFGESSANHEKECAIVVYSPSLLSSIAIRYLLSRILALPACFPTLYPGAFSQRRLLSQVYISLKISFAIFLVCSGKLRSNTFQHVVTQVYNRHLPITHQSLANDFVRVYYYYSIQSELISQSGTKVDINYGCNDREGETSEPNRLS
jgi:hypothetical protein